MKVSCQACGAKYTISDDKVRGRKVKIRCKSCGTPIVVDGANPPEGGADAVAPAPTAPVVAASAGGAPGDDASWSVNLSETDQRTMTTAEIVAGWTDGTVTHDAFVWKDGMGDWVAIGECEELKALLPAAAAATGTPFGPTVVTAPTPARLAGGRTGGVDLFDAAPPGEEDEVATSAPHLPAAGTSAYDDGKMTGARNENSVLFSLDSLKGGLTGQAPAPARKPEPKRPGASAPASSGDPFAMSPTDIGGGNPLFSLNANQALLTAPAAPEPPPPRVESVGGVAAKPMNKLLVYGGGGAAAALLLVVGLLIGRSGGTEAPATDGSAKASSSAEPEKQEEKKVEKKEEEKKEEAAAPATGSGTASAAPTAPSKVGGTPGTTPSPATKKPDAADTKKPDGAKMPATGSGPFSVSAAQVALTQAAANAASCAKPGGPRGSGKAQVTFAPSGRITSANVTTPPFAGTAVGGCVASVFRRARIPAFSGNPVTVSKSFSVK
jgi:predicted Zn finger-like uncharacterized protein